MPSSRLLVAAVVAGTVLSTLVAAASFTLAQSDSRAQQLELVADSVASDFQTELTRISDLGTDIAVALRRSGPLDHRGYAELLDDLQVEQRFPTLTGISLIDYVDREDLDGWLAARQAENDGFALHADADEPDLRAIRYSHPLPRNAAAVGFDISGQVESRQAADRALAYDQPQLSGASWIVQLDAQTPGAVLHVPLTARPDAPRGTLGLVIAIDDLLAGLEPLPAPVIVTVRDPGSSVFPLPATTGNADELQRRIAPTAVTRRVGIGERRWELDVHPAAEFVTLVDQAPAAIILVGGLLVAVLAALVVRGAAAREWLASGLADERTTQLASANHRLAESNRRLAQANGSLVQADRHKDEFLAAVSHELRTPLTVIGGLAETLRRVPEQTAPPQLLDPLDRNVARLDQLLEDLLTLAGLDVGRVLPRPEPVLLDEVLDTLLTDLGALAPEPLERPTDVEVAVLVDRRHLERILTNLLVNATRHGQKPYAVQVASPDEDPVTITVLDHGPGIAPDEQTRVFSRFERGARAERATGTGLGLAIVDELARLNHGSVHYERREGVTAFVVSLPRG